MTTGDTRAPLAIGFDVYGTLVDPLQMNRCLHSRFGDLADSVAAIWRDKQVEYAFRRGLMGRYENFGVCTRQALEFALLSLGLELSAGERGELIEEYQNLKPFSDVIPGIQALRGTGCKLVAFSNGQESVVRDLLERAGVLPFLDGVISVDDLKTFKPDPGVYMYLAERLGISMKDTCLVSSNPWDIIGAKSAGLQGTWIKRKPTAVFDPWGVVPDFVATDLEHLARQFSVVTQ
jgi:2-haloacid dehalogenase